MRIAIQMDPIAAINIDGDTSFALIEAAQALGHAIFFYTPDALSLVDAKAVARGHALTVRRVKGDHFTLGDAQMLDLSSMDVILIRQDPPFDMAYITTCHILDHVGPNTRVINDPRSVRDCPEKLFVTQFADLMPPTLISRDVDLIRAFRRDHGEIVIKPLYGNGGAGVFFLNADDANFDAVLEQFFAISREPVMVQAFVPGVRDGDKRIILLDGEPVGALNRIPADGQIRSNLAVGGRAAATDLSAADRAICDRLGPELKARGLYFVGIDVIAGRLTEINVTSPTGVRGILNLGGPDIARMFWEQLNPRFVHPCSGGHR
jgi:glutathione synthase